MIKKQSTDRPTLHNNEILNPQVRFYAPNTKCRINKIELTDTSTVFYLIHHADPLFIRGGWVRIHPEIFIRPSFSESEWRVKSILGIPIFPQQHNYNTSHESLNFKLVFPPIPIYVSSIDLIEKEPSDDTWFNFYGIQLV